jgi:hypothetical protein
MKKIIIIALSLLVIGGCEKIFIKPKNKTYQVIVSWDTTINKMRLNHCSRGSIGGQIIDGLRGEPKYFERGSDTLYYTEKDSCFFWFGGVLTTVLKTKPIMRVHINSKLCWMDTLMVANKGFHFNLNVHVMDYLIKNNKI